MTDGEEASQSRRCAVIYNPTKISDKFRALVEEGLQQKGWGNTLWLETSVEDPGGAITKQAALLPTLWPTPVQLLSRRPRRYDPSSVSGWLRSSGPAVDPVASAGSPR